MASFQIKIFLVICVVLQLLCADTFAGSSGEGRRHRRHRRRHRQNLLQSGEYLGNSSSSELVVAYRGNSLSNEENTSPNPGSMERRVENLEQYVRHLCLEDEDDVERRIRVLGVKCICPKMEAPVCGSDNVTYYNRCYLHCRAQQAIRSYHRYRITLKKFGPC